MASYSLNIVDNGDGTYTGTLLKSPTTAASGGTTLSVPAHMTMASVEDPKEIMLIATDRLANDLSANMTE